MWHVLVSSSSEALVDALRESEPDGAVVLSSHGVDDTLERLGRSARVDAVVTDDAAVLAAIREEMPGRLPVLVVEEGADAPGAWRSLEALLTGDGMATGRGA